MKKLYLSTGYLTFILLVIIDIFSIKFLPFGKFGTYLWFFSYLYVAIFACKCFWEIILYIPKKKSIFTSALIIFLLFIIFKNIPLATNLSGETPQEIACALNHIEQSPDKGFRQTCLFGYPARQYFLPTLPSLFFGRSLINLHTGGALYFILGLIIFSSAILKYFNFSLFGDLVGALILSSFFHIDFFNRLLFSFEQSIFPFSFALIISGLFLHYIKDKKNTPLFLFAFILYYLIFSYTPSLSLFFFSLMIIFCLFFNKNINKKQKYFFIFLFISSLLLFLISLGFRNDIQITGDKNITELTSDLLLAFKHLIFQTMGINFVSPVFNFIFIFLILSPLFLFWQNSLASLWAIAVLVIAVISRGYCYYGVDYRLHRALIIFPILFTNFVIILKKLKITKNKYIIKILCAYLIFFLSTGYIYQNQYLNTKLSGQQTLHFNFIKKLEKILAIDPKNKYKTLYFTDKAHKEFVSINDSLQYFIPNLHRQKLEQTDYTKTLSGQVIYVTTNDYSDYSIISKTDQTPYTFNDYKNSQASEASDISKDNTSTQYLIFIK
ncbi:hypothetical protein KKC08_00465 [Patescibacteria group bacterium]|nr:hypothetical protein [Patescibacteria group bacterium]MBU4264708.1 hypothetical protein [Patescibacteria group bacterium]MBU4390046.1 hypothetical protein [Patescibacteria group bacterium]MBU4396628.1 hypothetical protein [Patescibacteria group bacterium]MBU4431278.1 hypothetical protein [Patescibacteria group bacterium]